MDYKIFFEKHNAKKQLLRLENKLKNKRVVIYGAGLYSKALLENYDFSKFNIIGIVDRCFENNKQDLYMGYKTYVPEDLTTLDIDIILLSVYDVLKVWSYLKDELLVGTKNERVKILPIVHESVFEIIKDYLKSLRAKTAFS